MAHYFIAIPIPGNLKNFYENWQQELQPVVSYKRWMHPEDFHITLKFLGEMDEASTDKLRKKISQLSLPKSFIIELGRIGFFGTSNQPRVLWVDVEKTNELILFQEKIEEAAYTIGMAKERRTFRPHMTLAKKWNGSSRLTEDTKAALLQEYSQVQKLHISEATLFRIHPKQDPSYEPVVTFPLL